jgi:hypothetical protein
MSKTKPPSSLDQLQTILTEVSEINKELCTGYNERMPEPILDKMTELSIHLGRTNELFADVEYLLNVAKGEASEKITTTNVTRYKDEMNKEVAQYIKVWRFVERVNASIVHILDVLRSQLSYHKEDNKNSR